MTLKPGLIIIILAFALLIQNTCPHGFAGKTSVVSTCKHCPIKQNQKPDSDGQKNITVSASSEVHFPLFVFAVPKTIHTFHLSLVQSPGLVLEDRYEDVLPDELLQPPQV